MIQRYQDEQWARYDAQQQALADARAALAREVADVRARQVAAKAAQRRTETQLEMEERERMQEEAEHVARLEADARAAAQAGELRHKLDLRAKVRTGGYRWVFEGCGAGSGCRNWHSQRYRQSLWGRPVRGRGSNAMWRVDLDCCFKCACQCGCCYLWRALGLVGRGRPRRCWQM